MGNSRQGSGFEHMERLAARGFVLGGALFWAIAAFAGPYLSRESGLDASVRAAMMPLVAAVVILVIGWTYEHLAAFLLFNAAAAVFVWGVLYEWEFGVWLVMTLVLIAPMTTSAILFMLAARSEARRIEQAALAEKVVPFVPRPSQRPLKRPEPQTQTPSR